MIKKNLKKIIQVWEARCEKSVILEYKKYLPKTIQPKTALLSYLSRPFLISSSFSARTKHNSWSIVRNIAKNLNELGFIVDIIDWQNTSFIPSKKYDLFIGHAGKNFENIEKQLNKDCIKIFFSTGLYWKFWNFSETQRLKNAGTRKNCEFQPDRMINESEEGALQKANAIISLGNEFCRKTYAGFSEVYMLDNFYRPDYRFNLAGKNFSAAKNNFLFLSGPGNIHKGLDLLLEAFLKTPDKHLYICTKLNKDFAQAYHQEIFKTANVHYIGFVKEFSRELRNIMYLCNYYIYPSCGEGSPGSVIWSMSYGLMPALSMESCLDINPVGYQFKENTIDELIKFIKSTDNINIDYEKAKTIVEYTENNFSEKLFSKKLKNILKTIINKSIS
jgi:glycosyltransferase involved in cell wall biosynthesis